MAKAKIDAAGNSALSTLRTRMLAGTPAETMTVDEVKDLLKGRSITDVGSFNLKEGEILIIPDNPLEHVYPRPFNGKTYPALGCVTDKGEAKAVFLNTFHKSIPCYGRDAVALGTGKNAGMYPEGKAFYDKVMSCPTDEKLVETLAGMNIKVAKIYKVQTAHYTNGSIDGVRDANLPCFEEIS